MQPDPTSEQLVREWLKTQGCSEASFWYDLQEQCEEHGYDVDVANQQALLTTWLQHVFPHLGDERDVLVLRTRLAKARHQEAVRREMKAEEDKQETPRSYEDVVEAEAEAEAEEEEADQPVVGGHTSAQAQPTVLAPFNLLPHTEAEVCVAGRVLGSLFSRHHFHIDDPLRGSDLEDFPVAQQFAIDAAQAYIQEQSS